MSVEVYISAFDDDEIIAYLSSIMSLAEVIRDWPDTKDFNEKLEHGYLLCAVREAVEERVERLKKEGT